MTALHYAALKNNVPMMKRLLEHGADINAKRSGEHCNSHDTPLNEAAKRGNMDAVRFLIAQKGIAWGGEEKGKKNTLLPIPLK